ncbi:MAG: class I SAM-dependent methyltransferase [Spirochaetales bacterium]|nr:class I SAM-dependent methyltransferase [Spirochaetales bacterium]
MKKTTPKYNSIERTALVTLAIRAGDFRREQPILSDKDALSIYESIDYDFPSLKIPEMTAVGSLIRMAYIDIKTRDFILQRPEPRIVINLGAGLDTRYERIGCPEDVLWYDVDLPDIITLRKKFLPESPKRKMIAGSLFDYAWLDRVEAPRPASILVIAEGVLMYAEKEKARELLLKMKEKLDKYELVFDLVSPLYKKLSHVKPSLRRMGASFKWGLSNTRQLNKWFDGIAVLEDFRYFNGQWSEAGSYNLLRFVPFVNNLSRVAYVSVR